MGTLACPLGPVTFTTPPPDHWLPDSKMST